MRFGARVATENSSRGVAGGWMLPMFSMYERMSSPTMRSRGCVRPLMRSYHCSAEVR
jgi:hypothetical protein